MGVGRPLGDRVWAGYRLGEAETLWTPASSPVSMVIWGRQVFCEASAEGLLGALSEFIWWGIRCMDVGQ